MLEQSVFPIDNVDSFVERGVDAEGVRNLLTGPHPALLIAMDGTILACNGLAAWLSEKPEPKALLRENIYLLSAEYLVTQRVLFSCNRKFAFRKLRTIRELDPGREWTAHRVLRGVVRSKLDIKQGCPIPFHTRPGGGESKWQYPLCIRRPGQKSIVDPVDVLRFNVSDIRVLDTDGKVPANPTRMRFVVLFEPASRDTSDLLGKIVQDRLELLSVQPNLEEIGSMLYNDVSTSIVNIMFRQMEKEDHIDENRLGERIRTLRMLGRISADELARRVGVSRATITHWESGRRRPQDPYHLKRLFEVLDPNAGDHDPDTSTAETTDVEDRLSHLGDNLESAQRRVERIVKIQAEISKLQSALTNELADLEATFAEGKLVVPSVAPSHGHVMKQHGAELSVSGKPRDS